MSRNPKIDLLTALLNGSGPFRGVKIDKMEVHAMDEKGNLRPSSFEDMLNTMFGQPSRQAEREDDATLDDLSDLIKGIIREHLDDGSDVSDTERAEGTALLSKIVAATSMREVDDVGTIIQNLHNQKANKLSQKRHVFYHSLLNAVAPIAFAKFGEDAVINYVDNHMGDNKTTA